MAVVVHTLVVDLKVPPQCHIATTVIIPVTETVAKSCFLKMRRNISKLFLVTNSMLVQLAFPGKLYSLTGRIILSMLKGVSDRVIIGQGMIVTVSLLTDICSDHFPASTVYMHSSLYRVSILVPYIVHSNIRTVTQMLNRQIWYH